ncbi:MAG: hypothetical protein IIA14_07420 [SAR324 cluster bacterium]|nr:hypothetical protein [SAR324 cluster bacterium]
MATPGKTARALGMVGLVAMLMLAGLPAPAPAQQYRTLAAGAGENDRGAHKDFSLRLVFALQSGPYVGGVSVTIRDESGRTVVDTLSPGPWLFVALPPGTYRVKASREEGGAASAEVTISGAKQTRAYITWPR